MSHLAFEIILRLAKAGIAFIVGTIVFGFLIGPVGATPTAELALLAELPMAAFCFWIAFRAERFHARAVKSVESHLPAAGESATEGDLVGVLEVAADGQPAGEPGHPDAAA